MIFPSEITRPLRPKATQRKTQAFPYIIEASPADSSVAALRSLVNATLPELRDLVRSHGALLLRGFALSRPEDFAEIAASIGGPLGDSYEGPSPRKVLAKGVYSASEVPGHLVVPEHAEMSYLKQMARHLFFWCRTPAPEGGATTLVDGRRVLAELEPSRVERLLAAPLKIRRRHARAEGRHDPFELKRWPEAFGAKSQEELLQHVESLGSRAYFERDGAVTLESFQDAVRVHPETNERAWLNHLLVFHASAPAALLRSALINERRLSAGALVPFAETYRRFGWLFGPGVATDVRLNSGEPIPDATVAHVREVVDRLAVPLLWQQGDLVIVDNHIALHGRRPFRGPRDVVVAWSDARA